MTPQDHHAGALHHALLPLHRFRRPQGLRRRRSLLRRPRRHLPRRRSPTSPRPAAATSSSTRSPSPCCATPPSATRSRAPGRTPTSWSISTSRPSTTASPARLPTWSIGIHMCRGNFRGRYLSEGGYESVAERFFTGTNVTHFLLEYDTARAGDFKPLRFVPKSKGVVLGLVSTKTPVLETLDELQRRTDEAAKFIDLRPPRHRPAVRLCLHRRRQSADRGRRARQARSARRGRPYPLGLSTASAGTLSQARTFRGSRGANATNGLEQGCAWHTSCCKSAWIWAGWPESRAQAGGRRPAEESLNADFSASAGRYDQIALAPAGAGARARAAAAPVDQEPARLRPDPPRGPPGRTPRAHHYRGRLRRPRPDRFGQLSHQRRARSAR